MGSNDDPAGLVHSSVVGIGVFAIGLALAVVPVLSVRDYPVAEVVIGRLNDLGAVSRRCAATTVILALAVGGLATAPTGRTRMTSAVWERVESGGTQRERASTGFCESSNGAPVIATADRVVESVRTRSNYRDRYRSRNQY